MGTDYADNPYTSEVTQNGVVVWVFLNIHHQCWIFKPYDSSGRLIPCKQKKVPLLHNAERGDGRRIIHREDRINLEKEIKKFILDLPNQPKISKKS
ncbi:MAG: hypothetical protein PHT54_01370 [Candidatus Nanoarchaeia archaeon]|nr:hypothetical protein [Candidatus Nanoarchaeia archaeon]